MATTTTSYGSITITEVQEGSQIWTTTVAPAIPSYTFTVSNLIGDSNASVKVGDIIMYSYYRYTVLSVSADGTTVFTGNRQGFASTVYQLIVSPVTVIKDKNGVYSPYYVTLTAKSKTGTNTMGNYQGRFKIETTTDNENWETQYTSTLNESTVELDFSELDDIVALRCSLYASGGTSTLLDQQVISVVTDGVDGNDAYTVILTNENHTFAGNTTSAIASEIECNVIAYKGTTQIAATIGTITGQPTGMTTSLLNNGTVNAVFRVSVTSSMVTKNGVLNVPITVDNKVFTKKFTYGLALDGEDGKDGGRWYSGTSITGTSTTATVFSNSGISSAVEGDMYLNTSTYNTYRCTLGGDASTAKWVYINNIKGVHGDTGKGVSSIVNQYYLSTSNTTQTGGSWSTTVPPYVEDCYYWTKSHIVWTDNTETDTTAVLDNGLTDANANAIDARKVATNYLSMDSTGIMVADMQDGEQTPRSATGKNVFIDSDSVEIRNGQTVLSSFGNNTVILGQLGKPRLELSSTSISSISEVGVKNFNIISGSSEKEKTITKNGTFENTSSETDKFSGSFTISDEFYYFHNIAATISFNYIWDGQTYTSAPLTLNIDDPVENETQTAWYIGEEEYLSSYSLNKEMRCTVQHNANMTFLYFDYSAQIKPQTTSVSYQIGNDALYSVVIETKTYQNTSYTFGSRVTNAEHGANSFAIGEGLVASSNNQIAVGRYNDDDSEKNYAFMVGNGIYGESRSNAFAVDWNGHTEMGDINGYGLQLLENSQSEMDNYIECIDVNDNTIFSVSKTGAVNSIGRVNASSINLQKENDSPTDYIQCQDENNNVKFNVSNNGDITTEGYITSTGDADIGGDLSVTGDINALGNINMSGLIQYNNKPMFKIVNKTFRSIGIGSGRSYTVARDIAIDGYKPMSIGGIKLTNNSSYNPSSNADAGWCVIPTFWLDYTTTIDHPNVQSDSIYFYIWNMHSSKGVNVDFNVRIIYIATDALGNN